MARYIGSVCHLCRRVGDKLMLKGGRCQTPKCTMEHKRRVKIGRGRRRRVSDRGLQLVEKQKARFSYGMMERQFRRFFAEAERQPGVTGDNLKVMLEKRLDNVVYRLGFGDSRAQARQLVLHRHITLNGRRASVPSRLVKEGDIVAVKETSMRTEYFKRVLEEIKAKTVPAWLSLDRVKLVAQVVSQPILDEASFKFDGKTIVEYYSR
ncbi:MAG: 30S ribosomal protein S4 [Dehalococcoidia bacterium]|nr:30S ribosomal protein S4 [Dehalococcoidia bacterium]